MMVSEREMSGCSLTSGHYPPCRGGGNPLSRGHPPPFAESVVGADLP